MRKQNSKFESLYLSNAGTKLHNNDFYACAEGDEFACYVIVDGLEEGNTEDPGARLAAEAVIEAFNEKPSIGKMALHRYIHKAHIALSHNSNRKELAASITIVVTDYQTMRYAYVGNTRFALFRKGALYRFSRDHSLSWEMMEEGAIPRDKIAEHEERNNLSRYIGHGGLLHPEISKKIKLQDGDILALYTRGMWECCDEDDLLAGITAAGNSLEQALENTERMLLDGAPGSNEIDNYSVSLVYADKVYLDPNKGKRLKKVLKILIPVLIILLIFSIILFFWLRNRAEKRENMEIAFTNGIEYLQDDNFIRAKEELNKAYSLAESLKDKARKTQIDEFRKMVEAVINADNLLDAGNFTDAQAAYLRAQSRSRYTDHVAARYITGRLEETAGYISVHDYITLGEALEEQGNYDGAEEKYMQARRLASQIYYADGKQEAMHALSNLYDNRQAEVDASKDQASAEIVAADYIIQGDRAVMEGDLVAAELYYVLAREQYTELGNATVLLAIEERLSAVEKKLEENKDLLSSADGFMVQGDQLMGIGQYDQAKRQYILARSIYSDLEESERLETVQEKISLAEAGIQRSKEPPSLFDAA